MNAMLYTPGKDEPIAVLDDVNVVSMNDNHSASPERVFFSTKKLGTGKKLLELIRDEKMTLKLDDGRTGSVLLQHSCVDSEGKSVGILRVLDSLQAEGQ
ncbi:MAG: hypothetical protein ACK2UO_23905 [Caldilineaceae bacterium]|jgi:hypothetical protein